ncbi:glycoside hydrolase family 15 protein [Aquimarina sp. AD10]|uniref:Glycoside hydrolase n=1 Tax=Aquimarina aggregata TaxID=1642818 RepID=A0A163CKP5_9FLAO|nr:MULTISPECIES: glycoside hydrolase family 15 protein [Aquimarina]AXT59492.1 glycoside hydrolase family 15 protein [Aquimarina sp. AD10]KZS42512.1 glycoside hydrolase [Aquimarina aggregata]RKN00393.1 glycoside hydrolase family 15 protein [Aquimarina sp. AD10]
MNNLDYGIIGNCRSAALVSKQGSIDWCCLPQFDSPTVFGKLLDKEIGGSFGFVVDDSYTIKQSYIENTVILVTTFSNGLDIFEVRDFMPRYYKENGSYHSPPEFIRYIKHVAGKPSLKVIYDPKLEYAKGETSTYIKNDFVVSLTSNEAFDSLFLYTDFDKDAIVKGHDLTITSDHFFQVAYNEKLFTPNLKKAILEYERTKIYWLNWMERTPSYKRYNNYIARSAMTLKLLSYDRSGAILAAVTTSLPETIGEVRNWDYRFCWIRDASMVVKVISQLGHKNIAKRYLEFIINLITDKDEKLQIMYGINGEKELTEESLDHLSGYENSSPVRIGNAAYKQKQNDIYGILMDVIHQLLLNFNNDIENGEELWGITKGIVWVVSKHWQEPDKGIWEFRSEDQHFTFSKVLCWTAVDKAIKVAKMLGKTSKLARWQLLEEAIRQDIMEHAWSDSAQAFTQAYGVDDLDASVLLMESYGFIDAKHPKYVSTVKAIERELSNDGLLYRYKNKDDFGLPSSSFTICTFWFINSLYKIGEEQKAIKQFDKLLSYSNHLGLFSEDLDFKTKRLLGNFPQAYSHLALIETAINLSKITEEEKIRDILS